MKGAMMKVPIRGKTAKSSSSRFSEPARPFSTPPVEERTLEDLDAWMESAGRLGHSLDNLHVGGNAEGPANSAAGTAPIQRMPQHHPLNKDRVGKKKMGAYKRTSQSKSARLSAAAAQNRAKKAAKKRPPPGGGGGGGGR